MHRWRFVALLGLLAAAALAAVLPGPWRFLSVGVVLLITGVAGIFIGRNSSWQDAIGRSLPNAVAVSGVIIAAAISILLWSGLFLLTHGGSFVLGWKGTLAGFGSLLLMSAGLTWYSLKRKVS